MSFVKEFKEFAMKGNVVDMAVGVIIGAAFGKIVASLVNDVIMPGLSIFTGGVNLSGLFINLSSEHFSSLDEAIKAGAAVIKYGSFLQAIIDFTIIAFALFCTIRLLNALKTPPPAAPTPAPVIPEDIQLLREIRDQLKK